MDSDLTTTTTEEGADIIMNLGIYNISYGSMVLVHAFGFVIEFCWLLFVPIIVFLEISRGFNLSGQWHILRWLLTLSEVFTV